MPQETFYFPHDYNPLEDSNLQSFIGVYGAVGYGVYWRVVEKLHSSFTHRLPLAKLTYLSISGQLSVPWEKVEEMVLSCIETFELFLTDGETFSCNRVDRNIIKRAEVVKQRSNAGKESAKKRKAAQKLAEMYPDIDLSDLTNVNNDFNDRSTTVHECSTVVHKGKERKGN